MPTCLQPYFDQDTNQAYPCGKCQACYIRRCQEWTVRLLEEDLVAKSSYFVTFTYDNDHIHITPKGFATLNPTDLVLYFKRLRKAHSKSERSYIRYYAVGEYGSRTNRPHYHALIFNADPELIEKKWSHGGTARMHYRDAKPIGQVHFGAVESASVGYCLKYMCKVSKIGLYHWDDRLPAFARMSKGLGSSYIEKMIFWHRDDILNRMYIPLKDGGKVSMPRYYKERIYFNTEREDIGWHALKASLDSLEREIIKYGEHWHRDMLANRRASFNVMKDNFLKSSKL